MSRNDQMTRLGEISGLMLDVRLAALQAANRAKEESLAQLAGLAAPVAPAKGLSEVTAELAALSYQRWADVRRAELNLVLARQTAVWMDAREAARQAFGKKQALAGIARKLAENAPK
jgi:hypothetical protein